MSGTDPKTAVPRGTSASRDRCRQQRRRRRPTWAWLVIDSLLVNGVWAVHWVIDGVSAEYRVGCTDYWGTFHTLRGTMTPEVARVVALYLAYETPTRIAFSGPRQDLHLYTTWPFVLNRPWNDISDKPYEMLPLPPDDPPRDDCDHKRRYALIQEGD